MVSLQRTISVSPSGRYRVVAKTVRAVTHGYDADSVILLCDNKGNFLLNLAPTNQRSINVLWKRDETELIVNNACANSGDYLVYAKQTYQGVWSVLRRSCDSPASHRRFPEDILNPGMKHYWDFRYKIYGVGFQGEAVVVVMWLRAIHKIKGGKEKFKTTSAGQHYRLRSGEIGQFPSPRQLRRLDSELRLG